MTKTPEQMAEEFFENWQPEKPKYIRPKARQYALEKVTECFLAGYQAAKDTYKDAIDTYEDVAKQMLEEAVRIMSPKDQLADTDKVMCNTTMEEIKAVDTGELMPITNLPTSAKWISVKDRLPEDEREVLVVYCGEGIQDVHMSWYEGDEFGWATLGYVSHWMELPAPPREEK